MEILDPAFLEIYVSITSYVLGLSVDDTRKALRLVNQRLVGRLENAILASASNITLYNQMKDVKKSAEERNDMLVKYCK